MTYAEKTKQALLEIFGAVPKGFPMEKIAIHLLDHANKQGIEVSPYGYIKYLLEARGSEALLSSIAGSDKYCQQFTEITKQEIRQLPVMLVNAASYMETTVNSIGSLSDALTMLKTMSPAYALYALIAKNMPELAEQFKQDTEEYVKRYPAAVAALPEPYKEALKSLVK